mgnify:CR=1 FL=1
MHGNLRVSRCQAELRVRCDGFLLDVGLELARGGYPAHDVSARDGVREILERQEVRGEFVEPHHLEDGRPGLEAPFAEEGEFHPGARDFPALGYEIGDES